MAGRAWDRGEAAVNRRTSTEHCSGNTTRCATAGTGRVAKDGFEHTFSAMTSPNSTAELSMGAVHGPVKER